MICFPFESCIIFSLFWYEKHREDQISLLTNIAGNVNGFFPFVRIAISHRPLWKYSRNFFFIYILGSILVKSCWAKLEDQYRTELILDPEMGLCFDECCPGSSEGIFGMSRSSKGINWAASLYGGGDPLRALVQPNSWVIRSRSRTFDPSGCRERVIGYIGWDYYYIYIYVWRDTPPSFINPASFIHHLLLTY